MNNLLISSECNYIKHIITPITPYFICDHYFSKEIYNTNNKYIGINIKSLLKKNVNDLYKNININSIKDGDIIQVQVDLFEEFINDILPKINCKIIMITSQWHLPQINKNKLTEEVINNNKIILWISQNPIYTNKVKYMAFPYGINHLSVNRYINFLKKNYKKIEDKNILYYNSPFILHSHLEKNHIRHHPIFNNIKNNILPYENYLYNILKSKFTISTAGDRDDCYRHYECIGLNSIPISNISYKEIFENNMIYLNDNDIIETISKNKIIGYDKTKNFIDKDIILIDYWKEKISLRLKNI